MPLREIFSELIDDGGEAGRLRLLDCGVAGQPPSWSIYRHTWRRCGAWLLLCTCFRAELSLPNDNIRYRHFLLSSAPIVDST